jgi:hypothetical protein
MIGLGKPNSPTAAGIVKGTVMVKGYVLLSVSCSLITSHISTESGKTNNALKTVNTPQKTRKRIVPLLQFLNVEFQTVLLQL